MASAYQDRDGSGWIASFRPLYGRGKRRRRVRVPYNRMRKASQADDADAFAKECDHYCRLLEGAPTPEQIRHARELGAITQEQFDAVRQGFPAPAIGADPFAPPTLEQLYDLHPSTVRESEANQQDYLKHKRQLSAFVVWSGITHAADLTLAIAQQWVAEMGAREFAWDTRRHHLIALRRAAKMATTIGLPDPLTGFRLDSDSAEPADIPCWSLAELMRATAWLHAEDPRGLAVLALGGCVGLRCSEIQRLQIGDIDGDVLRIGLRARKNRSSRRDLPLPSIVATWVAPLTRIGSPEHPLIPSLSPSGEGAWNPATWSHWLTPLLATATGRRLPPKSLRASFATWAVRHARISTDAVERYLGHQRSDVAAVTHRHYLAEARVAELRPHADALDQAIRTALVEHGWGFSVQRCGERGERHAQ